MGEAKVFLQRPADGRFAPLYFGFDDPDRQMRAAEDWRQRYEAMYGGEWIVIQGTTTEALLNERSAIRATKEPEGDVQPELPDDIPF